MKKILLNLVVCCALSVTTTANANADLIAGWDFQTTATGGTAAAAAPGAPLTYTANFGTGSLKLDGTSGSSAWTSTNPNPQVTSFAGSNVNTAGTGFSTTTSGTASLALANNAANGKSLVFAFSMAGYKDLAVSYSTQRTMTGFTTQAWEYSTNGTSWTAFDSKVTTGAATTFASVGVVNLAAVTALNQAATAYLRLTLSGATAAAGNNRLDNIQLNASVAAVPEPASMLLASIAGVTGGYGAWRRRNAKKA